MASSYFCGYVKLIEAKMLKKAECYSKDPPKTRAYVKETARDNPCSCFAICREGGTQLRCPFHMGNIKPERGSPSPQIRDGEPNSRTTYSCTGDDKGDRAKCQALPPKDINYRTFISTWSPVTNSVWFYFVWSTHGACCIIYGVYEDQGSSSLLVPHISIGSRNNRSW
ncbi:hypothetical protein GDO78_006477 [Eleutherodactylus coqui]|uniref:Uncharacterized protein n=1 Tax=Eleutherodactylus coqui TaxID=57060 RepID=A0A8J6FPJ6_ELECQ|nr:hypothetical protein GDO78_006477 [Eleutherodactylus coqui]